MHEKNWFNEMFKDVSKAQFILIGSLIAWFIYLGVATGYTPNLYNETNPQTNETIWKTHYTTDSEVPKGVVTGERQAIGIGLSIVLFMSFILRGRKLSGAMTEREAKELFIKEWNIKKGIPFDNGFLEAEAYDLMEIFSVIPKYETIGQERKLVRYVISIKLFDRRFQVPRYFKVYVQPYDRRLEGTVETDKSMMGWDRCERCGGTEYDVKYITSEDIQKFKQYNKEMGKI